MADQKHAFFDCEKFMTRTGKARKNLAVDLGLGESTVGNYCTGFSTPNYSTIEKLIELGVTAEELFGLHFGKMLIENSSKAGMVCENKARYIPAEVLNSSDFQEGLQKAIDNKVDAAVEKALKNKGIL